MEVLKMVRKLLAVGLIWLIFGTNLAVAAENVVIKGSTTVLPVAQAALEAYMKAHPGVNISLSGAGSGDGIKALIDKSTVIANSSREIKDNEITLAREKGVNPVAHTIAIDALTPIVHPKNKVNGLTIDQLSQIYQGKITNWKEVGGDDLTIIVVSRDSSSGTFEAWGHLVLNNAKVTPKAQLQASNGAVVQAVSKGLTVNGIPASAKTALSKEYPIARPLYMYTNGQPEGVVADFIKFVLSPAGQKLVVKEGFVPITGEAKEKTSKKIKKQ
jgi:phosphate transport system substrate-binding protein